MTGKSVDAATTARTPLVDEFDSDIRFDLPSYLKSMVFPRPSRASDVDGQSVEFRCRRLQGMLNLYSWAMAWTVHDINDWRLGLEPRPFTVNSTCLSLMSIQALDDLPREWAEIADVIRVRRSNDSCAPVASVRFEDVVWDEENDTLTVRPASIATTSFNVDDNTGSLKSLEHRKVPSAEYTQHDYVTSVYFLMYGTCPICNEQVRTTSRNVLCPGCSTFEGGSLKEPVSVDVTFGANHRFISWLEISGEMQDAFRSVDPDLRKAGIKWTAPPFFREFQCGVDLLEDMVIRGQKPQIVLADLEEERRRRENELNSVIRAEVSDSAILTRGLGHPPTPTQQAVWRALFRRALNADHLAAEVTGGDRPRLYNTNRQRKTGGLTEMRDVELVDHLHTVGYFRPDAPPDLLANVKPTVCIANRPIGTPTLALR